jgi:hypothetical protein
MIPTILALSLTAAELIAPPEERLRGIVLGLFSADPDHDYDPALREIRELGANAVSLMVVSTTPTVRSLEIRSNPWGGGGDRHVLRALTSAQKLGLRVHLIPTLHVIDVAPGRWRGTLAPPSWQEWFEVYARQIWHYAELAERGRAELFSVGSELISAEGQVEHWRRLIDGVRRRYSGRLTYTSNWDALDRISFADQLDVLGMNAYYEVGRAQNDGRLPPVAELAERWREVRNQIELWSRRHQRPVLVTEVGYPSLRSALAQPWNYLAQDRVDLEAQRRGYQAFLSAFAEADFLEGVFFYDWWGDGGPEDAGYTPRNKPAEEILRCWFAGLAPSDDGVLH